MNTYEMIKIAAVSFEIKNKVAEGADREKLIEDGYNPELVDGVLKLIEQEKEKG